MIFKNLNKTNKKKIKKIITNNINFNYFTKIIFSHKFKEN